MGGDIAEWSARQIHAITTNETKYQSSPSSKPDAKANLIPKTRTNGGRVDKQERSKSKPT